MNPAQFARRQSHIISSRLLNVGRTQHMATVHNYDDKTDFDLDLSEKKLFKYIRYPIIRTSSPRHENQEMSVLPTIAKS